MHTKSSNRFRLLLVRPRRFTCIFGRLVVCPDSFLLLSSPNHVERSRSQFSCCDKMSSMSHRARANITSYLVRWGFAGQRWSSRFRTYSLPPDVDRHTSSRDDVPIRLRISVRYLDPSFSERRRRDHGVITNSYSCSSSSMLEHQYWEQMSTEVGIDICANNVSSMRSWLQTLRSDDVSLVVRTDVKTTAKAPSSQLVCDTFR